ILTQRAINELEKTIVHAERPDGTALKRAAAISISGLSDRSVGDLAAQGYERIADPRFKDHVFDKNIADLIKRYQGIDLRLPKGWEAAAKINRQLLRFVMFSPHIHGLNIARRMGGFAVNHPMELARYLRHGKALLPAQMDDASRQLRMEARRAGVMAPRGAKSWQQQFTDTLDSALGHNGEHVQYDPTARTNRMLNALGAPWRGYQSYEDGFWRWVSDFAVGAYHVEKAAAKNRGMSEADATAWAARRANSWAGYVLPEDSHPVTA